ncbi:hypothetical protein [Isoptericola sp. NPDC057391]|uniref:hypothetical protein n=1 Tax=Isoptericola sp. NPDC057391 TaxID=3346117 RepID=UPI003643E6FF
MYAWIFRHLPGNTFWRVLQSLVLVAAVVAALFLWVFPAIAPYLTLLEGDPAVG